MTKRPVLPCHIRHVKILSQKCSKQQDNTGLFVMYLLRTFQLKLSYTAASRLIRVLYVTVRQYVLFQVGLSARTVG